MTKKSGDQMVNLHVLIPLDHRKALDTRARKESITLGQLLRRVVAAYIVTIRQEAISGQPEK